MRARRKAPCIILIVEINAISSPLDPPLVVDDPGRMRLCATVLTLIDEVRSWNVAILRANFKSQNVRWELQKSWYTGCWIRGRRTFQ